MQKIRDFFVLLKKLLEPVNVVKKQSIAYFAHLLYETVSSIILIQLAALIIAAVEIKDTALLYRYIIIFAVVHIIWIANIWLGSRSRTYLNIYMRTFLNKKHLKKFIDSDNNKIESYGTGRMSNILFMGTNRRINLLVNALFPLITTICAIIYGFVVVANAVTFPIFLLFLAVFVVGLGFVILSFIKSTKYRKLAKNIDIVLDRRKIKVLMSKFEIFQNNKFPSEARFLDKTSDKLFSTWRKHSIVRNKRDTGNWLVGSGARIVLYLIFGLGVISGIYTISYLVLLTGLLSRITSYIYHIKMHIRTIAESIIHVEKLRDVMEKIPLIESSSNLKKFVLTKGDIKIEKMWFAYGDTEKIFRNFSLDIKGGKKTALVGESGSGKSTLIKLMAGYLHTEKGSLLVDGQSLKDVSLQTYYKHIGYLTQEPSVFDGTIIENLTYALKKKPSDAQLNKIIKAAKCEFIKKFKKGLKTEIGERGIRLSGGQKQRLAIAKIMLKDPEIILLDEPTSALDSVSEQKVADALQNLFAGRTVIVIAHRLQTVKEADDIIVLEQGKIVERGTHKQLEKKNGIYKRMLDLQTTF